ncbi:MAG: DNA mismatch repair protein MutS [Defluviitaleaceae bacterium]|nr:DNA mismatch repair protein MutS [Defluviitaleaceae bacterium]
MARDKQTYTPMMRQFLEIKEQYQDAFLFFRLGDFYELFFEDAELAAKELEIALTGRVSGEDRIPMCGVPHHAADGYIDKLLAKGYKVAICEQMDDPKTTKGMVRREVTQVITPGTVMRGASLSEKESNYLIALEQADRHVALTYADLSTGQMYAVSVDSSELVSKLIALDSKEIVVNEQFDQALLAQLLGLKQMVLSVENEGVMPLQFEQLAKPILDQTLYTSCARLVNYIARTQPAALLLLQVVRLTDTDDYMKLDHNSRMNLELTQTIRKKTRQGSLLWLLDETQTAMGARLLKNWILNPLTDLSQINERLSHVDAFKENLMNLEAFRRAITGVYDLERLIGRVAATTANARDLLQLSLSLAKLPEIASLLQHISTEMYEAHAFSDVSEMVQLINEALDLEAGIELKAGGMMKDGYDAQLDAYRHVMKNGKTWILELEQQERARSGIKSLKIKYNKVFGYHIEVSTSNLHLVHDGLGYERRQTLANCERFITAELKEKEDIILNASDRAIALEYQLFVTLRDRLKTFVSHVQENAKKMAYFDVIHSFAHVATEYGYVRPTLVSEGKMDIVAGRHPVVEQVLGDSTYVENSCVMPEDVSIFLITGPNMSGKSTYMRQVALIAVMAQMGSFVPATSATLPVFDQIFTRIGAGDDLTSGHSTFMVEMMETNYALQHATGKSLILLDEIGRGTATFDGMALAQGIIEYIHAHIGAKTLFATHYHELTALEATLSGLQNLHVRAKEHQGKLVFMHQVSPGASDKSYGIHVARIANMPEAVTTRAKALLQQFETTGTRQQESAVQVEADLTDETSAIAKQMIAQLNQLDINLLSPMQALVTLSELKETLIKKG